MLYLHVWIQYGVSSFSSELLYIHIDHRDMWYFHVLIECVASRLTFELPYIHIDHMNKWPFHAFHSLMCNFHVLMYGFNVALQIWLVRCLMFTLITGISNISMYGFNVLLQVWLLSCLIFLMKKLILIKVLLHPLCRKFIPGLCLPIWNIMFG